MQPSTASTAAAPAVLQGGDYNLIPYVSRPFPQSQPARLAALAAMFGLSPPDVAHGSVLELGCASGGNIIPLAARFPGARFRGVDLTVRHVREAQARIETLGLTNIKIEQGDIGALDLGSERFDFIICHGVYSWVPPAVREAILSLASRHLAANGIAYISYNVFPGWQMRGVIRDMMIYHAGTGGDPSMRVGKARWVLENIAKSAREGSPYGEMLRGEAKSLAGTDDAYILGEFLAEENAPVYFRDFIAKAQSYGLTYLCEAELHQCIPEHISTEVGELIRVMSQNKLIPLEQYMDFFKGRTFRQTLLVKSEQGAKIKRTLLPEYAKKLHVRARLTCTDNGDGSWVLSTPQNGSLTTRSDIVRRALIKLSEAYPATRSATELAAQVHAGEGEAAIADAVFKMILRGLVSASTVPLRPSGAARAKPQARPLARLDAEQGGTWTTDADHNVAPLDVVSAALLPFLDGTRDREALRAKLREAVGEGRIRLIDNKSGLALTGDALTTAIAEHVDLSLDRLATAGLLE